MARGFSLVELSIVLVILGLLTGGILSGQSLIRASELRSVTVDMGRVRSAIYGFRDKYLALPGDMANATKFWGIDPDGCPTHTNRVAKSATCDGNGNGQVETGSELFRGWQQLADAELIEGSYTGVAGPATVYDHDPGINAPKLKLSNGGISFFYLGTIPSGFAVYNFPAAYGNVLEFGACLTYDCINALFKPEEAWNIDTKMDDGKPAPAACSRASVPPTTAACRIAIRRPPPTPPRRKVRRRPTTWAAAASVVR